MRIESALYTSISSLAAHGSALAVVSNNVSNSSTTGFRASRTEFADIYADGPDGGSSTSVPSSGNGTKVQKVRELQISGEIELTGRSLDFAVEGNGYFTLRRGTEEFYTKAGNFQINEAGELVNIDGIPVMGYAPGATELSTLNLRNPDISVTPSTQVNLAGNLSSTAENSVIPTAPQSFSAIRAAAAATSSVSVVDSLGETHNIFVAFFKNSANDWTAQSYIDGAEVGGTAGVPVQIGGNAPLIFDNTGAMQTADQTNAVINATPAYTNGAATGGFAIDFSRFSQYAANSPLAIASITQNGISSGSIVNYSVSSSGEIVASLDSGLQASVGTIALTNFVNVDDLRKSGSNLYVTGENVGEVTTGQPTTNGLGEITNGGLERSNVDLASAFVELVVLQRGYQANSQMVEAINRMIEKAYSIVR